MKTQYRGILFGSARRVCAVVVDKGALIAHATMQQSGTMCQFVGTVGGAAPRADAPVSALLRPNY